MSRFSEIVTQTSHVGIYYPGANVCSPGNCDSSTPVAVCNGCDWKFSTVDCATGCPSQPVCSQLDIGTCPILGDNQTADWNTDLTGGCLTPQVRCTYDAASFNSRDIADYALNFCPGADCSEVANFNNIIMPNFCVTDSTNCSNDPDTGRPWTSCPTFLDEGPDGDLCHDWQSNNVSIADATMLNYCTNGCGQLSETCSCINRESSEIYQIINNGLVDRGQYSPGCWYKPCTLPASYLVTSNLLVNNCPMDEICPQINDIIAITQTDITQADFQQELNCTITATPIPLPPDSSNIVIEPTTITTSNDIFIWIIVIVIFIIFVLIILFAIGSKSSKFKK